MAGIINNQQFRTDSLNPQDADGDEQQRQARAAVLGEVAADVYKQKQTEELQRQQRAYGIKKAMQAKNTATTRRWTVTDAAKAKAKKARGY
jgi:hypothetical protein